MNINEIANKIAKNIVVGLECEEDTNKEQVIAYGLFALIHTLISIALVGAIGIIFNVLLEALTVSFTIAILRKASGGAHMRTPWGCAFSGAIIAVGFGLIAAHMRGSSQVIVYFGIIIFTIGYYLIYKLAPVDSPSKPIKKAEKIKILKKKSILILSIYMIIVVGLSISIYIQPNLQLVKYILCIYFGVSWQIFTLTHSGHKLLDKMDNFFNKITKVKGE